MGVHHEVLPCLKRFFIMFVCLSEIIPPPVQTKRSDFRNCWPKEVSALTYFGQCLKGVDHHYLSLLITVRSRCNLCCSLSPFFPTLTPPAPSLTRFFTLLQESISDFYWYYSGKDVIDEQGQRNFSKAINVAKQVFNTLTEYIQVCHNTPVLQLWRTNNCSSQILLTSWWEGLK